MEIKEKLDKLVMFLANEKDIPLDAAKRNRDAIMEQTIKNLKKELKEKILKILKSLRKH